MVLSWNAVPPGFAGVQQLWGLRGISASSCSSSTIKATVLHTHVNDESALTTPQCLLQYLARVQEQTMGPKSTVKACL